MPHSVRESSSGDGSSTYPAVRVGIESQFYTDLHAIGGAVLVVVARNQKPCLLLFS